MTAPGAELAAMTRETPWTTTNVTVNNVAPAALIAGLSIQVTGEGAPVDIDFHAALARHSVPGSFVLAYLVTNGAVALTGMGRVHSPSASVGSTLRLSRRPVLQAGVLYTFQIGIQGSAVGTVTLDASTAVPLELKATQR